MKPAWIRTIPEEEAEGLLAELYRKEGDRRTGQVDNILKVHSLAPETLRDHAHLYHTIMHKSSGLTHAEREMIGVVVSFLNECHY